MKTHRYSIPQEFNPVALAALCEEHNAIAEIDGDKMEATLRMNDESQFFIGLVKIK